MTIYAATSALMYKLFGSPNRDRLAGEISDLWIEFDRQVGRDGSGLTETWARGACRSQADGYLADGSIQQGWVALQSARRALLSRPNNEGGISRAATMLRCEAEKKITGWRSNAIKNLLGEPTSEPDSERVIEALWLRDDYFNTDYFKISLRRRQLFHLFLILSLVIAILMFLFLKVLNDPYLETGRIAAVMLFGALGAAVSVSQGLLATDVSAKIPAQQIGSVVVWMRPAIGAVLALVALIVLYGNERFKIFSDAWDRQHLGVILAFAFIAGFSERFLVGAIERIAGGRRH
jgi:hypothetical protein